MKEIVKCMDCHSNKVIQVEIEHGKITSKKYVEGSPDENLFIGYGLVDLQINGFVGVDFNSYPISESGFLKTIDALIKEGVTSFFPTVITNSDEKILELLKNIDQLCQNNSRINEFIGGIHLEGPFISPVDGAKGAHDERFIKAPNWELFEMFQTAAGNRIKIVTISSEWDNAPEFIHKCVANNVIVSLGHSVATSDQIRKAVDAGASMSTHLGNGVPLNLPRNSNIIFDQLASDQLTASIIADGHHLPDSFLKTVLNSKKDRVVLISDSTMFAGMEPGVYESHIGGKVMLEQDARLSTRNNPKILAGSAVSILDCVKKVVKSDLANIHKAWSMASLIPLNQVGEYPKDIVNNDGGDLVLFQLKDKNVSIHKVFKKDRLFHSKS